MLLLVEIAELTGMLNQNIANVSPMLSLSMIFKIAYCFHRFLLLFLDKDDSIMDVEKTINGIDFWFKWISALFPPKYHLRFLNFTEKRSWYKICTNRFVKFALKNEINREEINLDDIWDWSINFSSIQKNDEIFEFLDFLRLIIMAYVVNQRFTAQFRDTDRFSVVQMFFILT